MNTDECVLCPYVSRSLCGDETVTCGARGLETIVKCSKVWKDGADKLFEGKTSVAVNVGCRKAYTRRPRSPERAPSVDRSRRSSTNQSFDFRTHCFLCEKVVDVAHPDRRPISRCATLGAIHNLREKAKGRNDDWGNSVAIRLSGVSDLVAAEGMYHRDCEAYFHRVGSVQPGTDSHAKLGRKEDKERSDAFNYLCKKLEAESDGDSQYSMEELQIKFKECDSSVEPYSEKQLRRKLKERYGDQITCTELPGLKTVVCFSGVAQRIICDNWYKDRCTDLKKEEIRIVRSAAQIIRSKIKSKAYDNSVYPSAEEIASGGNDLIPELLQLFLEELLPKGNEGVTRKSIMIQHEIVAISRPRSFLSPVQVGLGVALHRRYGSRWIIDVLHSLGVCSSYNECTKFEEALARSPRPTIESHGYIQAVFDNADHNISTLDGHNTFHAMGGILCVTPKSAVHADAPVPRNATQSGRPVGFLPVQTYIPPNVNGYSELTAIDMSEATLDSSGFSRASSVDILWSSGVWSGASPHPGWNGFMEVAHQFQLYETTSVTPLPFINLAATNLSTINTALLHASNLCEEHGQSICMVTMDLPLYVKALEMVLASPEDSPLRKIKPRLGGFHLLKSFLGTMSIMAGSGLEECLGVLHSKNTVSHMMNGEAFSRAIRGHYLVQLAFTTLALESVKENDYKDILSTLSSKLQSGEITIEDVEHSTPVQSLLQALQRFLQDAAERSQTAKLWTQYYEMVSIVRMFIMAERSSNWSLHLLSVQRMLPYFHAANHLQYAKAAQAYLQQMMELQTVLPPDEYTKFISYGYFSIRRSEKFWSGVWTDMTIEQVLMRAIKSVGGLTRGRGVTESTVGKWVQCAPACVGIIHAVETLSKVTVHSTDQHVELRDSRQKRDHIDLEKILMWLRLHNPLTRSTPELVSIATGRVAADTVTCHNAVEIGTASMKKMAGTPFSELHLQRRNGTVSLATAFKGLSVREKKVAIVQPNMLLHRMLIAKQSDEELAEYLTYELDDPPPALFLNGFLRKGTKSSMVQIFPSTGPVKNIRPHTVVVDGGFMLRQVEWRQENGDTYEQICNKYVDYLHCKYGSSKVIVVFDGYESSSTKDATHAQRALKGSVDVVVEPHIQFITNRDIFLSSGQNKTSLIRLLTQKLQSAGVQTVQAEADADRLIVTTAIDCAEKENTTWIVGKDTDLGVILTALTPTALDIVWFNPGINGKNPRLYSSKSCQEEMGDLQRHILFLHAVSGCDTTSATFQVGKTKPFNKLKHSKELQNVVEVFNSPTASQDEISKAGETFLLSLYPGKVHESLDKRRYEIYRKISAKQSSRLFKLEQLPPTSAAGRQHSLRVYHQVQEWRGNNLPPTEWGWREENGQLYAVTSTKPVAPDNLLLTVSCNCKTGCITNNCSCRKNQLECQDICGYCSDHGCTNRHTFVEDESSPDADLEDETMDDPDDPEETEEPPTTRRRV